MRADTLQRAWLLREVDGHAPEQLIASGLRAEGNRAAGALGVPDG
jgi:hypothetical protein